MNKYEILAQALQLTNETRRESYGHPADDFRRVARMSAPIMEAIVKGTIDARLGHALIMIQVKIARLLNTADHLDSVVDIAGYANTYAMILEEDERREIASDS